LSAVLAVHGGAGGLTRARLDGDTEAALRAGLATALRAGHAVLAGGGGALEAVVRAVVALEADPRFNAGRGSVLTADGRVEMDAAVMDGRARAVGAVACVSCVAHPVALARRVLERTDHVLLVGAGAEALADDGTPELTRVDPASLVTAERAAQLERLRAKDAGSGLDHDVDGTVGAVARDAAGHLAAATSTGGMVGQQPGRVGDSPIAGAGTWADDATCAVSATGQGETFVRCAFAHEVDASMRLAERRLGEACRQALARVAALGGRGGCIALGRSGPPALPFDTPAMLRGSIGADGVPRVAIFADESLAPC
jgi:isoaspartyl peptidase/L-asparaginase-like protein (Ntn-hydrolase superfamily)